MTNVETGAQYKPELVNHFNQKSADESLRLFRSIALLNLMKITIPGLEPVTKLDDQVIDFNVFFKAAVDRISPYKSKFEKIGVTTSEHVLAYVDAFSGQMRSVKKIVRKSEKRMDRKHVKPSISKEHLEANLEKYNEIIKELTKDIPTAKEVGKQQRVVIVAGPFASGKTEIFLDRLNSSDLVVIDLDVIRKRLSENYDPTNQRDIQRVREESWHVSDLLTIAALKQGKSVLMQTALHRRSRWLNDPSIIYAKENNIPIEINMILRPVTECMTRNMHRTRSVTLADLFESMNGMDVLIKFVQKFGNVSKVSLVDFYPMLRKSQSLSPKGFDYKYGKLIKYAAKRPDIFSIYHKKSELDILPD